jgi:hypothetical protein
VCADNCAFVVWLIVVGITSLTGCHIPRMLTTNWLPVPEVFKLPLTEVEKFLCAGVWIAISGKRAETEHFVSSLIQRLQNLTVSVFLLLDTSFNDLLCRGTLTM